MNVDPRKLIVEALGAFALCFFGMGAIVATQGGDLVAIALAHGLAIGLMILAAGHVSGGHYNPAVTTGMMVTGRISPPEGIAYIVAQLVGAVLGAFAVKVVAGKELLAAVGNAKPAVGTGFTSTEALVAEIIGTFFLVFVVFGTAVDKRSGGKWIAGLAIGLSISMSILAIGGVSGSAINPARWFGPALVFTDFKDFWIWIVGPIAGGVLAALLYQNVIMGNALDHATEEAEDSLEAAQARAEAAVAKRRRK